MVKGDLVLFDKDLYEVFHLYDSGYCEIKKADGKQIQLVHHTEVVVQKKNEDSTPTP
ncbi:hypothetical protein [Heyndrickxia acidicola]|uniref:Phage protein n=1 Tax=Heyndrickxia acidicola TaxID=209389 RepID=A0ABU6MES1_9BACI|nr:hypothetical protein [Heyndrickxia acidicola]MED1203149.1 hypothetical protein [Heyndrickxia acidicola]